MIENQSETYRPMLIGSTIGLFIGFFFGAISFFTAVSICSDTSIAETLFPFSFWLSPDHLHWGWAALLLALIQYPIYGLSAGFVYVQKRAGKRSILVLLVAVVIMHWLGVGAAKHRVNEMWEARFSNIR